MKSVNLIYLFCILFVKWCYGCICHEHPSDDVGICSSKILIQGKLIKNVVQLMPYHFAYEISNPVIYKGADYLPNNLTKVTVYAPDNDGACGLFRVDEDPNFLLSVNLNNGKIHTDLCKWNKRWASVSEETKTKLKNNNFKC